MNMIREFENEVNGDMKNGSNKKSENGKHIKCNNDNNYNNRTDNDKEKNKNSSSSSSSSSGDRKQNVPSWLVTGIRVKNILRSASSYLKEGSVIDVPSYGIATIKLDSGKVRIWPTGRGVGHAYCR